MTVPFSSYPRPMAEAWAHFTDAEDRLFRAQMAHSAAQTPQDVQLTLLTLRDALAEAYWARRVYDAELAKEAATLPSGVNVDGL